MKKKLLLLFAVLMTALAVNAATDYGFSVAEITVTSDNCNNIVSNYITSGTVYYTPSTNTLYMNNVTITMTGDYNRVINNLENDGLKVQFSGTCNLKAQDASVIRVRKHSTTLYAPSASTVVNITGVNDCAIYMATDNYPKLYFEGPGTFNIKSTNNTAIEDEDDSSGTQLDTWHEVYFDNVNAVLSSGGNSVIKRVLPRFKAGSSVRFKATNNSSYPVVNYCGWQLYGNEALLEPYGAYHDGSYVVDSNGNRVYNKDVYVSDDYVAIINATNFPDANFRSWLLENFPGYIHEGHVNNWGVFNLSGKNISNLKGIEYFTNLSSLNISNNNLTSVDLSHNTNLEDLYCSNNQLTSLNLSNLTNLEILDCSNNKLTTLSVTDKSYLKTLNCSNNTLLTTLYCYRCDLTTLNVTGCTALKDLRCFENASLTAITGLANCSAITYLDCEDCAITSLPGVNSMSNIATLLARNNKLTALTVANKSKLATLRVSGNTTLDALACNNNALTSLDVSGCTGLTELRCYENANLAAITGLANCTAITYLDCEDCAITDLPGVNNMTNIATLLARNNKLTTLMVIGKSNLKTLRVSGNTSLTNLKCYYNALTSLDVTGCSAMTYLDCCGNQLTSLSVSGCTALNHIEIYKNRISGTNMTNFVNSLPTRSSSNKGELRAIFNDGENNSMTSAQITAARNKYWLPKRWDGSVWVELTASQRGDVDGDGSINISDVTALIDYLLSGNASGVDTSAADCDQDNNVNISDVTALIDYLLSGAW